uniref:Uncharacterized protein n=1 Tax=Schistosoma mansoni TaxID=6183 RepID=A0A913KWL1_SCHMA
MMSEYSIEICSKLIPYFTSDVRLMDAHINMKYEFIEEFYIEFFKNEFLSKILEVKSNDGN